jgi:hypothetical protein
MSSLIFHIDKDQAFVAVDTLATDINGEPLMFTSKAFILPHLRMIMCGTGSGGFLGKWFIRVNDNMVVQGIDNLDYHATSTLQDLWQEHTDQLRKEYLGTATIYHFGFSETTKLIACYVYRSENNFKSEVHEQYGIGVKPECNVIKNYEFPKDIPAMMNEQRTIQSTKPISEKVYIGGEIIIFHLERKGILTYFLKKFEDYNETKARIISNYNIKMGK